MKKLQSPVFVISTVDDLNLTSYNKIAMNVVIIVHNMRVDICTKKWFFDFFFVIKISKTTLTDRRSKIKRWFIRTFRFPFSKSLPHLPIAPNHRVRTYFCSEGEKASGENRNKWGGGGGGGVKGEKLEIKKNSPMPMRARNKYVTEFTALGPATKAVAAAAEYTRTENHIYSKLHKYFPGEAKPQPPPAARCFSPPALTLVHRYRLWWGWWAGGRGGRVVAVEGCGFLFI